jgi:hypothetical protein
MKRLLMAALVFLSLEPLGCTLFFGNIGMVVEVTGTEGARYVGTIGGGDSIRTVEGTIPASIRIGFEKQARVALQKPGGGTMRVTVFHNGNFIKSEVTTATDGVVALSIRI